MNKTTIILILSLIVLCGLFFRITNIDKQSYWIDEALGIHDASKPDLPSLLESLKIDQPVAPGYFVLLHFWIKLFGMSELATRLLSVIFSVLSILFLYFSVRMIANDKVALLSSFFFAISLPEIVFAQETRFYACFTFFSILSTFFFIRILKKKDALNNYIFYFLSGVLALYINYLAVVLIFIHFSVFMLLKNESYEKKSMKIIITQILIMVSFLFWLPTFIVQFTYWQGMTKEILSGYNLPKFISSIGLFVIILPAVFIVFLMFILYLVNKKQNVLDILNKFNNNRPWFLLLLFLLIFILLFPFFIKSKMVIRHFLFLSPIVYSLVAYNIFILKKRKFMVFGVISLLMISSIFLYYNTTTKAEWREAINFIINTQDGSEGIIILEEGSNVWLTDIYYKGKMNIMPLWSNESISDEKFFSTVKQSDYAWLVLSRNWKRKNYYKELMDGEFGSPKLSKHFYDIDLYLYSIKY